MAKTVAPVELGDAAREDTEAHVPTPVTNPKESGDVKRSGHEWTHVAHMSRCSSCVAGRGNVRRSPKVRQLQWTAKRGV